MMWTGGCWCVCNTVNHHAEPINCFITGSIIILSATTVSIRGGLHFSRPESIGVFLVENDEGLSENIPFFLKAVRFAAD